MLKTTISGEVCHLSRLLCWSLYNGKIKHLAPLGVILYRFKIASRQTKPEDINKVIQSCFNNPRNLAKIRPILAHRDAETIWIHLFTPGLLQLPTYMSLT